MGNSQLSMTKLQNKTLRQLLHKIKIRLAKLVQNEYKNDIKKWDLKNN